MLIMLLSCDWLKTGRIQKSEDEDDVVEEGGGHYPYPLKLPNMFFHPIKGYKDSTAENVWWEICIRKK